MTESRPIDASLLSGVARFRWAAWVWLAGAAAFSLPSAAHPAAAIALVAAAGLVTFVSGRRPSAWILVVELGLAAVLVASDGWVYEGDRPLSLGGPWPIAGVLAVAVQVGSLGAVGAGAGLGLARFVDEWGNVASPFDWPASRWVAVLSTGVLYALAGWAGAYAAGRIRAAEDAAADARARARVARDLHDGMLQTLAAVQRRSDDDELVHLARAQEAELRAYLYGEPDRAADTDLVGALRRVVALSTSRFDLRVTTAIATDLPPLPADLVGAIAGAVGECLANVAKHAGVDRAHLYAEVDDDGGVTVKVRDRGSGFDPTTVMRRGLESSVSEPLASVGAAFELDSRVGNGSEVTIRVAQE